MRLPDRDGGIRPEGPSNSTSIPGRRTPLHTVWHFLSNRHTLVASMLMEINHRETAPGVIVIALSGRVMLGPESEQIVTLVEGLLRSGKLTIIFDMAGVRSLDSTGIGRFIACYNEILAGGGKMRMAGVTGHLADVFRVTKLDLVFPFYATVEEAARA
jgi:anti-sigma B factor antagonist